MSRLVFENIGRWLLIMAIQILVLNNIYLGGAFNPMLYVLVILSLPIEINAVIVLFIGFFTGLTLDIFTHTPGLHTMAATLLGFLRPFVLQFMAPRDGYPFGTRASLNDFGWGRYSVYALILVFTHHLWLFVWEGFFDGSPWLTIKKVVLNTLLTYVLVIIVQLFGQGKKANG